MYKSFDTKKYFGDMEGSLSRHIFGLSAEYHYFPNTVVVDDEAGSTIRVPKEFSFDCNLPFAWFRINVRKRYTEDD